MRRGDTTWETHLHDQELHATMVLYAIQQGATVAQEVGPIDAAKREQLQLIATMAAVTAQNEINRVFAQQAAAGSNT